MKLLQLAQEVAKELSNGTTPYAIAKALGITKTEVLNMADNAKSRDYTEINTMKTTKIYDSNILANSMNFAAANALRQWLKARRTVIKSRPVGMDGQTQAELVAISKKAREYFIQVFAHADENFDITAQCEEYCGFGREWGATGKKIKEFAEANNIDQALAAELVGRQTAVAQDYVQAERGAKLQEYINIVSNAADEAGDADYFEGMEEVLQQAYAKAAEWNQPGDGLMIRDFALSFGISECLPTWEENLKTNMPSAEAAAAAKAHISKRLEAKAAADAEAEAAIINNYGTF